MRYKEKFQALREKYDHVTAAHDEYQRDLEIATAKIKKLQAENDLLLDAMNLAAAHEPTLFKFVAPHEIGLDVRYISPPPHHDAANANNPSAPPRGSHFSPHAAHMNGGASSSSNGNSNGYANANTNTNGASLRSLDQPYERGGSPEYAQHEANGRAP